MGLMNWFYKPILEDIPLAKEEVGMIMRVARKIPPGDDDNFAVNSADAYMEQFNTMKKQ